MADPFIDDVDLLLRFNGTDGDKTTAPTIGSGSVTLIEGPGGFAEIDTADSFFGVSSLYTWSEGTKLEYGAAGDFDYLHDGTEDYTIEGFFKVSGTYKGNTLLSTVRSAAVDGGPGIVIDVPFNTTGAVGVTIISDPVLPVVASIHTGNGSVLPDVWYYYSLTHAVGVGLELKLDAVTKMTSALSSPIGDASGQLLMGHQNGGTNKYFNGWRDSIRITRGVARTITSVPAVDFEGFPPPAAIISSPSPLGAPSVFGVFDFTNLITDDQSFYTVELTGLPVIAIPVSSWQATIQIDRANYVQCVIPSASAYIAEISARQGVEEFVVYRETTINGVVNRAELARAPISTTLVNRGPTNYTLTMSGYADASPVPAVPAVREMKDIRFVGVDGAGKSRVRCAIDWFLKPGDTAVVLGDNIATSYINYYSTSFGDAYMDIGER